MQSKNTMVQKSLKTEQSRRPRPLSSSSNVIGSDRRQHTISRRSNTYPYCRNKKNSENCYKCGQSNDYIDILNARFAKIENLVENLSKTVKETTLTKKQNSPSHFGSVDLSKMNIDELLRFSSQLGIRLFGDKEKAQKLQNDQNDQNENKNLPNSPEHKE